MPHHAPPAVPRPRVAARLAVLVVTCLALMPLSLAAGDERPGLGDPPRVPGAQGPPHEVAPAKRVVAHLEPDGDPAAVAAAAHDLGYRVRDRVDALDALVLEAAGDGPTPAAQALEGLAGTAAVEDDPPVHATEVRPNDELFEVQWGPRHVTAPLAWQHTTGDPGVTIAVLDTAVDTRHEDLAGAFVARQDIVSGDPGATSHGTLTAGVAAARTNNALGIAGLCWQCSLMAVTVMDDDGMGRHSDVARGLIWAADHGADVANLSLGSHADSRILRDAVRYAHDSGVLVVAAAGNTGGTEAVYPAAYDEVLAVAATDRNDTLYWWSTRGSWVDLAAPGVNASTYPGGGYGWYSGTSSATPVVSGVAALALSYVPAATNRDVAAALRSTAVDVGGIGGGRVDAVAALAALDAMEPSRPPDPPPAAPPTRGPDPEIGDDPDRVVVTERLAGADRFETAARTSRERFEPGVEVVYVATGLAFPDALAAGAAAGSAGGPVLLSASAQLPSSTAEELRRLAPRSVVVAGGEAAISPAVVQRIREITGAPVRRVAGADRFRTAAALALDRFDGPVPVAFVATGVDFPDALAAVPAAVREGGPLLLASRDALPRATAEALEALSPERVVVLGGTQAISPTVADDLRAFTPDGEMPQRIAGSDRFETAARVAASMFETQVGTAHLATGTRFPDALAAGPAAAVREGPLLLVTRDTLPDPTRAQLERLAPTLITVVGGNVVVSTDVELSAGEAAGRGIPGS